MPSSSPEKARTSPQRSGYTTRTPIPAAWYWWPQAEGFTSRTKTIKNTKCPLGGKERTSTLNLCCLSTVQSPSSPDPMQNFITRCLIKLTERRMAMEADRLSLKPIWGR